MSHVIFPTCAGGGVLTYTATYASSNALMAPGLRVRGPLAACAVVMWLMSRSVVRSAKAHVVVTRR